MFEKLVTHLHDFAREVSLTTHEWMYVSRMRGVDLFFPVEAFADLREALTPQDGHQVLNGCGPDLLPDSARVYPPVGRPRSLCAGRLDESPDQAARNGGDGTRTFLHGRCRRCELVASSGRPRSET